jgi:hypothetical protein
MHVDELALAMSSKAQELELKEGISYDFLNRKEDRLKEAANIYMKMGEFELYCETMIKIGGWERALAVAPAASFEYWQKLQKRYAEHLAKSPHGEDHPAYHLLAASDVEGVNHWC